MGKEAALNGAMLRWTGMGRAAPERAGVAGQRDH